eukprot:comp17862_c0_seq1/m.18053 comp17862_c0_seq1/g.18053  ORF comp17862_c0_seq1/g.18053 comp17862_c0_seq1/m.18053 type:complete len:680 (-) comp17862_c0_seq1:483-2522(-)
MILLNSLILAVATCHSVVYGIHVGSIGPSTQSQIRFSKVLKSSFGPVSFGNNLPEDLKPGAKAKAFSVQTWNGEVSFDPQGKDFMPLIIYAFNSSDPTHTVMWSVDDSVDSFLKKTPASAQFLVMSYSEIDAKIETGYLHDRLAQRMEALGLSKEAQDNWEARLHFCTTGLNAKDTPQWISTWLAAWPQSARHFEFFVPEDGMHPVHVPRVDGHWAWAPSPAYVNVSVLWAGNGCSDLLPKRYDDTVVLVEGDLTQCTYATIVNNAQKTNAKGVMIMAGLNSPLQEVWCHGDDDCAQEINIPVSMIAHVHGAAIQQLLRRHPGNVKVTTASSVVPGYYAAINGQGELAEVGWQVWATLDVLAWAAQWYDYELELYHNLTKPATVVSIFEKQVMVGKVGVVANTTLPSDLHTYTTIELDMSLGCPGDTDAECPPWDHIVQLFVCCEGAPKETCWSEIARWITPFRRRIGRWLTDVSLLGGLLAPGRCSFNMKLDAWWAKPWVPSLSLRLSGQTEEAEHWPVTTKLMEGSYDFSSTYNGLFKPITFTNPPPGTQVQLASIITGHGSDKYQCGEFCVTSHHFIINGNHNVVTFSDAGTEWGCADRVREGIEPNEHGTWHYGRGGWCDGQDIKPWVVDITSQLNPEGQSNTILYQGYFRDSDPGPDQNGAYFFITAYLSYKHA